MKVPLPAFLRESRERELAREILGEAETIRELSTHTGWPRLMDRLRKSLMVAVGTMDMSSERAMAYDIGRAKGIVEILLQFEKAAEQPEQKKQGG